MHTPKRRPGRRKLLALAVLTQFPLSPTLTAAPAGNQANVELRTDLNTMAVQVGQGAPLPPGGCNPGYAWHTTYGGCRIAQKQSESTQCPSGQAGTRSRDRMAYVLQADPANVVYEEWGDWKDECRVAGPDTGMVCKYEARKSEVLFVYLLGQLPRIAFYWDGALVASTPAPAVYDPWSLDPLSVEYGGQKEVAQANGFRYSTGQFIEETSGSDNVAALSYDAFASFQICREPVNPPPIVYSKPCKYEPGRTELVFFRLPGGDPVTLMRWDGRYIVNRAVHSYGEIPGYRSGVLCGRGRYKMGALISSHGGSNDITVYEVCKGSTILPHHSNGQGANNGCATSTPTPLP